MSKSRLRHFAVLLGPLILTASGTVLAQPPAQPVTPGPEPVPPTAPPAPPPPAMPSNAPNAPEAAPSPNAPSGAAQTPTNLPAPAATPKQPSTKAAAPSQPQVQFMSLKLMLEKGLISKAEYDSAVKEIEQSTGQRAPDEGTVVVSKIAMTIYGFVEDDNIYDTTQSLNDLSGSALIARGNTVTGKNGRWTMGVRNTRLGFRMKAPDLDDGKIRTSGTIEADFLGNQEPIGSTQPYQISEGAFFTNPTFRVRHAYVKVETPWFTVLAGQYWQLFGWQPIYQPNTVQIQGVPGELYSRTPQVRLSETLKLSPVTIDGAIAMVRPVQRNAGTPDGEAGIRFALDSWQTLQTVGATGTQISPLSIAATGLLRHVSVENFSPSPTYTNDLGMAAWSVEGFVPIIPATKDNRANALSIQGEFSKGSGYADMFTGLTGGLTFLNPSSPPGATYTPDIDNGIVAYSTNGSLHSVDWETFMVGGQYYTPIMDGRLWVSGFWSYESSDNIYLWGNPTKLMSDMNWFDANLFVDASDFVRVGGEYANFNTQYVDGAHAINHRFQISAFLVF